MSVCVAVSGCAADRPASAPDTTRAAYEPEPPVVSRWVVARGKSNTRPRPVALLPGSSTTSKVLGIYRAVLEVTCYRSDPRVRAAYPATIARGGHLKVSYRFDAKPIRTIQVRVRGHHRNIVAMDDPGDVRAFVADMAGAKYLRMDISILPYDSHEAKFALYGSDQPVKEALAPCQSEPTKRAKREAPADDDDDKLADMAGAVVKGDD